MRTWWTRTTWPYVSAPHSCLHQTAKTRSPARLMWTRSSRPSSSTTRPSSPMPKNWRDPSTRSAWLVETTGEQHANIQQAIPALSSLLERRLFLRSGFSFLLGFKWNSSYQDVPSQLSVGQVISSIIKEAKDSDEVTSRSCTHFPKERV